MTPEFAMELWNMTRPALETEHGMTQKVIAAIPEDQGGYQPHPRGRTALELIAHICACDIWFLDAVADGGFAAAQPTMPSDLAALQQAYASQFAAAMSRVAALSGEQLAKPIDFLGYYSLPAAQYLTLFMIPHTAHHRGQLSTYFRAIGVKVPSIYGMSGDEQMGAGA